MNTKVVRLALNDPSAPLDQRIAALCDVYLAVGMHLAATNIVGTDMILIFQRSSFVATGTR